MTAWKIWPLPQSGTPRARVTAPLWPKTERSWVELSTLRLMGERTQHCRPWFFPAARFTPAVPTIGQMSESARRQSPPTCRLTGHFADRGATAELSEAGTNDNYRSGGARADRSRETARPCAGALGLPLPERTLRDRESEQNHEEGDRRRGLPARGGLHRIRRALSQFCGRCGGLRRRQRARFGFEHRIRPRHENRSLANRG